jgi:predicted aspartyl protease
MLRFIRLPLVQCSSRRKAAKVFDAAVHYCGTSKNTPSGALSFVPLLHNSVLHSSFFGMKRDRRAHSASSIGSTGAVAIFRNEPMSIERNLEVSGRVRLLRTLCILVVFATLTVACGFFRAASATPPSGLTMLSEEQLLQAAASGDSTLLEAEVRHFTDSRLKKLAQLEVAASRLDLAAARQYLKEYTQSGDTDRRHLAYAWSAAAGSFFSVGEYREAFEAARHWKTFLSTNSDATAELQDAENLASIAAPLSKAPRQVIVRKAFKTVPLTTDAVGLSRSSILINGTVTECVLDTGANISTVTVSMASTLGLRLLEAQASVGSATQQTVKTQIGVADSLELAGVSFKNVVFLVVPDDQLQVPVPGYRLDLIIGFPVFHALGAIRFEGKRGFTPLAASTDSEGSAMRFAGSDILIRARLNGEATTLQLDTGAAQTALSDVFAKSHRELIKGLNITDAHVAGAGGTVATKVANWNNVNIAIGNREANLATLPIDVDSLGRSGKYPGVLGSDVLSQFRAFEIDFLHRRFVLL